MTKKLGPRQPPNLQFMETCMKDPFVSLRAMYEMPPIKEDPLAGWTGSPQFHLDRTPPEKKK